MRFSCLNEDSILRKISEPAGSRRGSRAARQSLALGIGDDAALFLPQSGRQTILTCDWFLEETHFLREKHPPDSVGWKCLARAVSDVAAMGGKPRCFLLSLALPAALIGRWLEDFLAGLRRASRKFQCPLAGGDTTCRKEILINVTVVGEVPTGYAVRRSGARPGDLIYVSGHLGEAELGLRILKGEKKTPKRMDPLTKKHLFPEPRIALGEWLAKRRLASAMMDLSDGLSSDLPRLCAASGVGAQVEPGEIPMARSLDGDRAGRIDPLQLALHSGDDYELLFTVAPRKAKLVPHTFHGIVLTPIGKITKSKKVFLREGGHAREFLPGGWDPFRKAL